MKVPKSKEQRLPIDQRTQKILDHSLFEISHPLQPKTIKRTAIGIPIIKMKLMILSKTFELTE